MSQNVIFIAAAGSGKTKHILDEVEDKLKRGLSDCKKLAIITYTTLNQNNIKDRLVKKYGCIPQQISVMGWYTFLLDYWIRPFKGDVIQDLYTQHVGMFFSKEPSGIKKRSVGHWAHTYRKGDIWGKFFTPNHHDLYSDKLSEFAVECYNKAKEQILNRLSGIFSVIYIDESQDLAGWDFEVIRILANYEPLGIIMCGDPRQNTYSTSFSQKYYRYNGRPDKFVAERINTTTNNPVVVDTITLSKSHRCIEEICKFSNIIMPEFPASHACNCAKCVEARAAYGHLKGVFLLKESLEKDYLDEYKPVSLIWDSKSINKIKTQEYYNYGESKGLEEDAIIIYPTQKILDFININKPLKENSANKFYVAVTRARFACAILVPDDFANQKNLIPFWDNVHQ